MDKKTIVEFKNVRKEFLGGKIVANNNVTFNVSEGTIHTIAGENGAGKSTLLSMLFGLYKPTKGEIYVKGKAINYNSAKDAMADGLGMVQQHFQLVDVFTVTDSIILGSEKTSKGFLKRKEDATKIDSLIKKYNFNLKSNDKIKDLTVGQRQKVEILKLLFRDNDILIFDEPTAMLTPSEIDELLKIILDLKKKGKTIFLITHKLDEMKAVSDEVTVLRKGEFIGTISSKALTAKKLSEMMVGRNVEPVKLSKSNFGEEKLKVENLTVSKKGIKKLQDINFSIRGGEILSIAGVEGNGQVELAEAISGMIRPKNAKITLNGEDISKLNVNNRNRAKIAHIPEDRHKYGMFLDMKVYENMFIKNFRYEYSKFGVVNTNKMKKDARSIIHKFDVRGADGGAAIARGLSGGNQQKAVIAREMTGKPEVIIVFQATRGLDVGAIEFVHKQVLAARARGAAVLLISYDLNEVLALSDRIAVLNSGKITGIINRKDASRNVVGQLMTAKGKENNE